jgi:hypothetical protein
MSIHVNRSLLKTAGAALGLQAHNGNPGWNGTFTDVVKSASQRKPPGAFYTSSLHDGTTDWLRWAGQEMPKFLKDEMYLFEVVGDPNILVLRDDEAVRREVSRFGMRSCEHDPTDMLSDREFFRTFWENIMRTYDALHIPDDRDHLSYPALHFNSESTAWFTPARHLVCVGIEPRGEKRAPIVR